jgi:sulfite exporter TauE/SafE
LISHELWLLLLSAASIGFIHTIIGPDHYIPFVAMSKSGNWSLSKTTVITILCGIGHVIGSILLGFVGIGLGVALSKVEFLESVRGDIATWALIAFGFTYFVWGLHRAIKNKPHKHMHHHVDGEVHVHTHSHNTEHAHVHDQTAQKTLTPWILFTIFVLGPCEPLIPLLMYPAANESITGLVLVASTFGIVTVVTMLAAVLVSLYGINLLPLNSMERYMHAFAGAAVFICGISIQFLGL